MKKSAKAKREERAVYMRAYRLHRKADADDRAAELHEAEAAEAAGAAQAEAEERVTVEAQERARKEAEAHAAKQAEKSKRERIGVVAAALSGTAEACADLTHFIFLDADRPGLGTERASVLGNLWAPILEPHITEGTMTRLPLALAAAGSGTVLAGWVREYRAATTDGAGAGDVADAELDQDQGDVDDDDQPVRRTLRSLGGGA